MSAHQSQFRLAQKIMAENPRLSAAIIRNGTVLRSVTGSGVQPLLEALIDLDENARGTLLADKVLGLAPAWLAILFECAGAYAKTISQPAVTLLHQHGLMCRYQNRVPGILNRNRDGLCPLEAALLHAKTPEEAFEVMKHHPLLRWPDEIFLPRSIPAQRK
jgi:hypothetical protein